MFNAMFKLRLFFKKKFSVYTFFKKKVLGVSNFYLVFFITFLALAKHKSFFICRNIFPQNITVMFPEVKITYVCIQHFNFLALKIIL